MDGLDSIRPSFELGSEIPGKNGDDDLIDNCSYGVPWLGFKRDLLHRINDFRSSMVNTINWRCKRTIMNLRFVHDMIAYIHRMKTNEKKKDKK